MSLVTLGWLFTLGVLAHNTEEALFLPEWSAGAGRWHVAVGKVEFRFAVLMLSLLLVAAAVAASFSGATSVAAYIFAGYVLAMVANVLAPHVLATLALRRYMPGTASAVLFNLPLGGMFLYRALSEGYVQPMTFAWAGPLTALAILASIPVLFALGRWLRSRLDEHASTEK
ncbi:MAG: HXXEE domain-containing protein [Methylococcaceae bacterium]|nr:HXXEE domain-containing protein [Methylococcaceae bacterium]